MAEEKQDVSHEPLVGTEEATMDDKGRVLIGTKLRKRLGPSFTMCLGDNGSITVYPKYHWDVLVRDLMSRDPRLKARQDYARHIMGNSHDDLDCDSQGRVVVPKRLRSQAKIASDVIIKGLGDTMEIWAKDVYDTYQEAAPDPNQSYEDMLAARRFKPGESENGVQV